MTTSTMRETNTVEPKRVAASRGASGTRRARPRRTKRSVLLPIGVGLVLLVAWQLGAVASGNALMPTPIGIVRAIPVAFADPDFWTGTLETTVAIVTGLLAGCVLGTVVGIVSGRYRWFRGLISPYVSGLYAMPLIAMVPLVTIWLGYSPASRFAMIVVAAILPSIVSTADGARRVPKELEDAMAVLGVSRARRLVDLVLPTTLPFILAGANVAIGRAIVAAVAVEFLASVQGLGSFILVNSRSFHQDEAFVGVLLLVLLGVLGHFGIQLLTRKVAPWQHIES